MINKFALALTVFLAPSLSFAGGLAPVVVEETSLVEEKPASSINPLLILGLLVLIGVLVSRNGDDEDTTVQPTPLPPTPAP